MDSDDDNVVVERSRPWKQFCFIGMLIVLFILKWCTSIYKNTSTSMYKLMGSQTVETDCDNTFY